MYVLPGRGLPRLAAHLRRERSFLFLIEKKEAQTDDREYDGGNGGNEEVGQVFDAFILPYIQWCSFFIGLDSRHTTP